jgi:hypothetical protein
MFGSMNSLSATIQFAQECVPWMPGYPEQVHFASPLAPRENAAIRDQADTRQQ